MNPMMRISSFLFMFLTVILISCAKEHSCKNCESNQPPIAKAGADQIITLPTDTVRLDGSASVEPDGTIISYKWTKISGPVPSNIIKTDSSKTLVKTLVMGVYKFELTVTDNGGLLAKDTVQVTVNDPESNQVLKANAGPDQTITLPLDSTYLDGSGSSPNGWTLSTSTYSWTQISGPSQASLIPVNLLTTGYDPTTKIAGNLVLGTYLFKLQVTTSLGISNADTVRVNVVNDPHDKNTVTYHDLIWEQGDVYGLAEVLIFLTTSIRPDIFVISGPTGDLKYKPIEVQLKLDSVSVWTFVPYKNTSSYSYDRLPMLLWIICYPNNPSLVGKKSSMKIKFL